VTQSVTGVQRGTFARPSINIHTRNRSLNLFFFTSSLGLLAPPSSHEKHRSNSDRVLFLWVSLPEAMVKINRDERLYQRWLRDIRRGLHLPLLPDWRSRSRR